MRDARAAGVDSGRDAGADARRQPLPNDRGDQGERGVEPLARGAAGDGDGLAALQRRARQGGQALDDRPRRLRARDQDGEQGAAARRGDQHQSLAARARQLHQRARRQGARAQCG
eukprot:7382050-Prymnesium_polylepis.1